MNLRPFPHSLSISSTFSHSLSIFSQPGWQLAQLVQPCNRNLGKASKKWKNLGKFPKQEYLMAYMPDTTILFTTLRTIVTSEALVAETLWQWLEQLCFLNDSSFMISIFIKPYSKTIYCVDRFPLSRDIVQRLEGCQTRAAADITGFAHISLRLCQSPLSIPSKAPPLSSPCPLKPPPPPSPGGLICPLLHNTNSKEVHT